MSFDLKERRKELGLTLQDIADKVGVGASTVRKWENGMIDNIKQDKIPKLAEALKVSVFDILDINNDTSDIIPEITTVPIIGTIACGVPIFSEENYIGSMAVPTKDVKGGEYFALRAKGDSMSPRIENGDEVLIRKQPVAENGDIVAVSIDGEITLKRLKRTPSGIVLIPENQEYDPIVLSEDSQNYIVGKATKVSKTL